MPDHAPDVKVNAVRGYGAEVVFCKQAEREDRTRQLVEEVGATLIHPYDNADVIAGQGTAALELVDEVPDLDVIVAPVGGGGLLAGSAVVNRRRWTTRSDRCATEFATPPFRNPTPLRTDSSPVSANATSTFSTAA